MSKDLLTTLLIEVAMNYNYNNTTMKIRTVLFCILLFDAVCFSQNPCQTKEVRINYTNAIEIFNLCMSNPSVTFDDKKEYFWYTEFSGIKSTKGGSGGNLLHGNYKVYTKDGSLLEDGNYYLGLKDGTFRTWDSIGDITSTKKYQKDKLVYWKFLNEGYWIEYTIESTGELFGKGCIRKVYTQWGRIIEESIGIDFFEWHTRLFYDLSGKLKEDYFCKSSTHYYGKYISYYENGNIEVEAEYSTESPNEIRTGLWRWYNQDGTLNEQEEYRAEIVKWDNGKIKYAGGYVRDSETNEWLKTGEWQWYTEDGKYESSKKYRMGVDIETYLK